MRGGKKVEDMNLGVIRRVDKHGRIGIPVEVRRYLGLKEDDEVEFFIIEGGALIRRYDNRIELGEMRKRKKAGRA